jgi:transposase
MTLHPQIGYLIPPDTARVAREAFPTASPIMLLRDELGTIFADREFAELFPPVGQPAESPTRLLLVTIFQFMEGLTDRQAADAVRRCIDWKYALALELTDPGFHYSVLSEFRDRLRDQAVAVQYLDRLLAHCQARGWLKARGRQRTDSTHVLAAIRSLSRLEGVGEMLRHTLDVLAQVAPDWLYAWLAPDWFERYGTRFSDFRLPKTATARAALAVQIGTDGVALLNAVLDPSAPAWVRDLPVIQVLRLMWVQQFSPTAQGTRWRDDDTLPPAAQRIQSPYDPDARYSTKRTTEWLGYKVHITETCDDQTPHLITQVLTVPATTPDCGVIDQIQADLAARDRLPAEHLVDAGYVTAETLVSSQPHAVDLCGPIQRDHSWQARAAAGFDVACFTVNWETQQVICPHGQTSTTWSPTHNPDGRAVIHVSFAKRSCGACPVRANCTRSQTAGRELTLHPQAQHEAITTARERQTTTTFRRRYAKRAGIEGTIAQGVRRCDLRQARYRSLAKTSLQHVLTAMAINCARISNWLAETPQSQVRPSLFVRLAPARI